MFKCEGCKTVSQPRTKLHRVVVEKRLVTYNNGKINGGKGWEIAKEANLCEDCFNAIEVKS